MPRITVYAKDGCMPCTMTKRELKKAGIEFTEKRVDLDAGLVEEVTNLGYQSLPVIVDNATKETWSGFRPDKLKNLVQ